MLYGVCCHQRMIWSWSRVARFSQSGTAGYLLQGWTGNTGQPRSAACNAAASRGCGGVMA